ncbi:MAG: hypothetical protein NUV60_00565 [Patescibacteria group bacterium]|nr:hypothetical protein [Patescibacteria group bacterium]
MIPSKLMSSVEKIKKGLDEKNGVLVTKSAIVCRESYFGNDIIAPNSSPNKADSRGYVPVELWILSTVEAENAVRVTGEGLTKIKIFEEEVPLADLRHVAESLLFGEYAARWPLTKILDIGGKEVATSFGTTEIPPIPVHVHGGNIVHGSVNKPGKSEAYFFPPTDIPPYNKKLSVITRIGLKEGVTKEDIKQRLHSFGKDDSMYELLNEFPILPNTGWTVPEGVLHAPGPYLTFEVQLPQDDYNNGSWRLGERLSEKEREKKYEEHVLRGLPSEDDFIEKVLDWETTSDPELAKKYFHTPKRIDSGDWGERHQIFFDMFYGEEWKIFPGKTLTLAPKKEPQGGIVWSGEGDINGNKIAQDGMNEFLVIPHTEVKVKNTGTTPLFIYTVEPIRKP